MKTILISAGHSTVAPKDPGAVGHGYVEAEEALKLRDLTADRLREYHVEVTEDGADGVSEPLKKALVLARKANVAIEYHFNAAASDKATGVEVLAKAKNKSLAQKIAVAISNATGIMPRGDKGYKPDNSGQHHRLAFCEAGGLIVEVCFISNQNDMYRYSRTRADIANGVAVVLAAEVGAEKRTGADPCSLPNTNVIYEVQKGDTLFSIARKFAVGLSWLRAKNRLTSETITIGQKLIVKD